MTMEGEHSAGAGREDAFPWHLGVFDAHCHPTDTMASIQEIPSMKSRVLTIMATRSQDQHLVAETSDQLGLSQSSIAADEDCERASCEVIPSFGWHPWFSHHLYDDMDEGRGTSHDKLSHYTNVLNPTPPEEGFITALPEPRPLSAYIQQTKDYLLQYPLALVGEIGLDRSFRIPDASSTSPVHEPEPGQTPGSRNGKRLSRYRVDMSHQRRILEAQLYLAGEMQRAVSVHGVGAHGVLFETLRGTWKGHEKTVLSSRQRTRRASVAGAHDHEDEDEDDDEEDEVVPASDSLAPRPFPPRICLHSYSGPPETLRQYFHPSVPAAIYFSFSQVINFTTPAEKKTVGVIKAIPDHRILLESDVHHAGESMDQLLKEMTQSICDIKGWDLKEGVGQLARNWKEFAFGTV